MGDVDLIKGFVLPEFFRITEFDEGEAFREVVIEGAFEEQGIGGEVIGAGAVAAVGVGEDDVFGIRC